MTIPSITDLKSYIGRKLTEVEWDFNLAKIISYLTSGLYDFTINSLTLNSNLDMDDLKIINLADPENDQDAVNYRTFNNIELPVINTTYTVRSGLVDSNGFANIIAPNDNSSVTVTAGGANPNIVISHCDGSQEIMDEDVDIENITSDGTWIFVKEKGVATPVFSANVTADSVEPTSPTDGDYWCDISVNPYIPYKRVSGSWAITQFVPLGLAPRSEGIMGTPVSYAFNGLCVISNQTMNVEQYYTLNHNIGTTLISINGTATEEVTGKLVTLPNYFIVPEFSGGAYYGDITITTVTVYLATFGVCESPYGFIIKRAF